MHGVTVVQRASPTSCSEERRADRGTIFMRGTAPAAARLPDCTLLIVARWEEESVSLTRIVLGRIIFVTGVSGVIVASIGSSACIVDELPACPGQCFEYTVEYGVPLPCQSAMLEDIDIPFTGTDPDGYHGRVCLNSSSIPDVVATIEHLQGGGQLSELSEEVQSAYISTVNAVKGDVQAECITAAAGQCTDEFDLQAKYAEGRTAGSTIDK